MPQSKTKEADVADTQRPFMGLRSYEEKNKSQFGGRDTEIKELFSLIENNRLTIVFGKSGIGKTSLINAGLIPELQKNYYFPVYIRIDYYSTKSPLSQFKELVYEKLKISDSNISKFGDRTLWEYFHEVKFHDGLLTPVLILDQFEETFTIGKEKNREMHDFVIELSDLAENRVPLLVQEKYQNKSEMISSSYTDQSYHVIISLREDYLAQLESFKRYLPSLKKSRFRVVQMTVLQAMDAVMKPAKSLIEKDVAAEIIKKLPGISEADFEVSPAEQENVDKLIVEPFLLSLICYEINEKRIERNMGKINSELVAQFDISDVIDSYYNKTMGVFSENVQQGIEDSMLTESGYRKLQELEQLESAYKISDNDIQQLIEKRIIRKELRDGVEYIELIHDVLTPVIKAKRDKRLKELREKERSESIKLAIELDRNKRKKALRTALLIIVPLLIILGYISILVRSERREKRAAKLEFAKALLSTASGVSNIYADDTTAALISRAAFIINKNNKGKYDVDFYNAMYDRLEVLAVDFEFANYDNVPTKAIVNSGKDIFYIGNEDGKVWEKVPGQPEQLFYDFKETVTDIEISNDKRYLAVSGVFDNVRIFDLKKNPQVSRDLYTGDTAGNRKSVCFTETGSLILQLDSRIMGWQADSWEPIVWKNRIHVEVDNANMSTANRPALWNMDYFEYPGVNSFKCLTVFRDRIAVGIDSGVFLINQDSLIKVTANNLGSTTSTEFDASGKFLLVGTRVGTICRISLDNFNIECNQYQTKQISHIVISGDGKYMATASLDGTVGIWDLYNKWNISTPLLVSKPCEKTNAICVAFTENSKNVLAGYNNGYIWKWPVNMNILAEMICDKVQTKLDTSSWKKYVKKNVTLKELEEYRCDTIVE